MHTLETGLPSEGNNHSGESQQYVEIIYFLYLSPNSALAITSAGIGGWHTVDVSIVNNNSYSVLGWATDSPSTARTSLPNVIAIGF